MLTKEQKQNMKERLEKAKGLVYSSNFCKEISCLKCPLHNEQRLCVKCRIDNEVDEGLEILNIKTCPKCGAVLDDEK